MIKYEDRARIDNLPAWARAIFNDLESERDTSINALNKFLDENSVSPLYVEKPLSLGEHSSGPSYKKRYINGNKLMIDWGGVEMRINLTKQDGNEVIDISYELSGPPFDRTPIFQPISFQKFWVYVAGEAK